MKIKLLAMLVILPIASRAGNIVANFDGTWDKTVSTQIMSKYYGDIFADIFYNGPMSFTKISGQRTDPLGATYVDLNVGQKLDRLSSYNKDGGNEYDFDVGRKVVFDTGLPVTADMKVTYLATHNLRRSGDDFISQSLQLSVADTPFVQPYISFFRFDTLGKTSGSGWFVYGGFTREQKTGIRFRDKPVTATLDYRLGYSGGVLMRSSGLAYHRLSISLPFEFDNEWTVTPVILGQSSGHGQQTGRAFIDQSRFFATITIAKKL